MTEKYWNFDSCDVNDISNKVIKVGNPEKTLIPVMLQCCLYILHEKFWKSLPSIQTTWKKPFY